MFNPEATPSAFHQIKSSFILNGQKKKKSTNALLDPGSDSTLISADLAHQLNLKRKYQEVSFSNILEMYKVIQSKLVGFKFLLNSSCKERQVKNKL